MLFLTSESWARALSDITLPFQTLPDTQNVGSRRVGRYRETWVDMLNVLGALCILDSHYVDKRAIPDDLPPGVENPFAIDLRPARPSSYLG